MTKARTRRRRRRQGRTRWLTLENVSLIKQFFVTVGPIVVGAYLWVIPQIQAQAAEYLKGQLTLIGMNPENIEALNKNIVELQAKVVEKDNAVKNLSDEVLRMQGDIGKVLILLQTQPQQVPVTQPVK